MTANNSIFNKLRDEKNELTKIDIFAYQMLNDEQANELLNLYTANKPDLANLLFASSEEPKHYDKDFLKNYREWRISLLTKELDLLESCFCNFR